MKTISVDHLDHRLAEALKRSEIDEPVLLTESATPVGVLIRVPAEFKSADLEVAIVFQGPDGTRFFLIQAKTPQWAHTTPAAKPEFGSCRGMLAVIAEDEEHLADFGVYMP